MTIMIMIIARIMIIIILIIIIVIKVITTPDLLKFLLGKQSRWRYFIAGFE